MFPRLFTHGDFFIPSYGVLLAIGFLLGLWVASRLGRRAGIPSERITDIGFYAAISGMIGSRLTMFLFDWDYFSAHPGEILSLSTLQAGGVYQGGLLLALAVSLWYMRRRGLPVLRTADVFAPGVAIGHAVGRLGCFSAGCCWGAPAHGAPSVTFTDPFAAERFGTPLGVPLHPSQLYEAGAELLVFAWLWRRCVRPHPDGAVLAEYLILYSAVRFAVEFVRHHEQSLQLGLSLTQWISLATLAAGLWLYARTASGTRPRPQMS